MSSVVVIAGATTGVGKTWAAAGMIQELRRRSVEVYARKPVQSFDPSDGATDADLLATAAGETPDTVCPPHRSLPRALAPPMAASLLSLPPFTVADLAVETLIPPQGITIVEGVGGPRSPIASDGDTVELARLLGADLIVVVVDAALGAINAALVTAGQFPFAESVVFLNRFDASNEVHSLNAAWLADKEGLAVASTIAELADHVYERTHVEVG